MEGILDLIETATEVGELNQDENRTPRWKPVPNANVFGVRKYHVWDQLGDNNERSNVGFDRGVMFQVKFQSRRYTEEDKKSDPYGCYGDYAGHAIGELVAGAEPKVEMLKTARKLNFSVSDGEFRDAETWALLTEAKALFLLPHNESFYLP